MKILKASAACRSTEILEYTRPMIRLVMATLISVTVALIFFLMIKMWGGSQPFIDYKHPFYTQVTEPLIFKVLTPENIREELKKERNIYLNVAMTFDKRLIVIDRHYEKEKQIKENSTYKFQSKNFEELITADPQSPVLLEAYRDQLKDKKIIFNIQDTPLQITPVFIDTMKKLNLDSGNNFIFISAYEAPAKDLKEIQPTYLFGSSDPEILKIKAMESLYLIEAATFRADFVIHPLTYYKQPFFTETLIHDLERRHKRFIIGPLQDGEMDEALKLKPFGIIVN